jgi:hypothetical protein
VILLRKFIHRVLRSFTNFFVGDQFEILTFISDFETNLFDSLLLVPENIKFQVAILSCICVNRHVIVTRPLTNP